jgi:hypothetical protein
MQPWKWATFQLTPDHPWTVTLPDLAVMAQLSFARVMLVYVHASNASLQGLINRPPSWLLTSVVVPLVISSVVVFPQPRGRLHEPSPLTFSLIRLAMDAYLNKIAPAPVFGDWSASILTRFGDLQLLLAGLAAAFSFYEVVA